MKLTHGAVVATSLFLSTAGCRSDSSEPAVDAAPTADDKIQDVQNDAMPDGTKVKLDGVIVTAIDTFGARTNNFYVQEPEGGAYSGVLVFGAKATEVAKLAVGDLVNLDGIEKDEFLPPGDASMRTITELKAVSGGTITITKVAKGTVPAPAEVDALAIAALPVADRDAELEKWEGVPITVHNVAQLTAVTAIGGKTPDPTFFKFVINGGVEVDTSLAAFPDSLSPDTCFTSITGMGDYFYAYKILPRASSEIVTGGTGCPAPEVGAAACRNSIDDDLDGVSDCMDRSCQRDFDSTCQVTATIPEVQLGTYDKTGPAPGVVILNDVYVTAVTAPPDTTRSKSVWVSQSYDAAANEGVQVFLNKAAIPANVVIGAKIDVVGTVQEFDFMTPGDKLTEIDDPAFRVEAAPDGTPFTPITGIAVPTVADPGVAGEPYEGTLMQFAGLKVTALGAAGDTVTLSDTATPANTITMDDDIFDYTNGTEVKMDTCYATVTAIASFNTFVVPAGTRMILPRAITDLVEDPTGDACVAPGLRR